MKNARYIAALLMALNMGITHGFGQAAHRSESREQTGRTTVKKTENVQSNQERAVTPQTRSSQERVDPAVAARHQQARDHHEAVERPEATRYNQTASREKTHQDRPVSISTPDNPRSDYRKPDTRVYVKPNKYSSERYYSGNYYHRVYPDRHVKLNYHHDTYLHHYNVLYYPAYMEIYWTHNMYRDYRDWYPDYHWRYNYGHRIQTISVFDAKYNLGEVAMVYGRVYATWHNDDSDDYLLFFGGDYPYQQFSVVLPGRIARRFNWRPERYFLGVHLTVTGLITTYDGIPEIIVKNSRQIGIY